MAYPFCLIALKTGDLSEMPLPEVIRAIRHRPCVPACRPAALGGHIERLNRELMQHLKGLPGTTGISVKDSKLRVRRDPHVKLACLFLQHHLLRDGKKSAPSLVRLNRSRF